MFSRIGFMETGLMQQTRPIPLDIRFEQPPMILHQTAIGMLQILLLLFDPPQLLLQPHPHRFLLIQLLPHPFLLLLRLNIQLRRLLPEPTHHLPFHLTYGLFDVLLVEGELFF